MTPPNKAELFKLIRTRVTGDAPHRFFVAWVHGYQNIFGILAGSTEKLVRLRLEGIIEDMLEDGSAAAEALREEIRECEGLAASRDTNDPTWAQARLVELRAELARLETTPGPSPANPKEKRK